MAKQHSWQVTICVAELARHHDDYTINSYQSIHTSSNRNLRLANEDSSHAPVTGPTEKSRCSLSTSPPIFTPAKQGWVASNDANDGGKAASRQVVVLVGACSVKKATLCFRAVSCQQLPLTQSLYDVSLTHPQTLLFGMLHARAYTHNR